MTGSGVWEYTNWMELGNVRIRDDIYGMVHVKTLNRKISDDIQSND
jgi:hypothetical protein